MKKNSLLIVDDEMNIRSSLKRALRKWAERSQIQLYSAGTAAEAKEFLVEHHKETALILSDQKMPGQQGADFLIEITKSYPHIVKIILTGHAATDDISDYIDAGIFAFLEKPWNQEQLLFTLDKAYRYYQLEQKERERERIMQLEIQMAADFQKSFLRSELPYSKTIDFDFAHINAGKLPFGGDYFDIIHLGKERYIVLLGDVAGHGLKASFIVAVLKSIIHSEYIRDYFIEEPILNFISPSHLLNWLNKRISSILQFTPDIFVALCVCFIDAPKRKLVFANAGQPPLILVKENQVEEITQKSIVLGVDPDQKYTESAIDFDQQDILTLCTDGVYPSGKESDHVDITFFHELLLELRQSDHYAERIFNALLKMEHSIILDDDATIMSMKLRDDPES